MARRLQVTAQGLSSAAQVTLLRADPDDNQVSLNGNLDVAVPGVETDIAIELSDAGDTITYVVHCIPAGFPDINILKTEDASDGLLLVTPRYVPATVVGYVAIVEQERRTAISPVPGWRELIRRHADAPADRWQAGPILDQATRFGWDCSTNSAEVIGSVQVVAALTSTDYHDFLITR